MSEKIKLVQGDTRPALVEGRRWMILGVLGIVGAVGLEFVHMVIRGGSH